MVKKRGGGGGGGGVNLKSRPKFIKSMLANYVFKYASE